jgi:hypothetical protein
MSSFAYSNMMIFPLSNVCFSFSAGVLVAYSLKNYYYYYSLSPFFPWTMNLSTADLRNYRTEFHETLWSYRYMFLVGPKVFSFYHYVKLYVSIIIHLEVININVRNFNFPIGFYSNPTPFEPLKI